VDLTRLAVWIIWCAYVLLGVLGAAFLFLLEPERVDIAGVTLALILMGVGSVFTAVVLLIGSVVATRAMLYNSSARRTSVVLTALAGWIGTLLLGWLAWNSWTE
jgi:hypothetical protein